MRDGDHRHDAQSDEGRHAGENGLHDRLEPAGERQAEHNERGGAEDRVPDEPYPSGCVWNDKEVKNPEQGIKQHRQDKSKRANGSECSSWYFVKSGSRSSPNRRRLAGKTAALMPDGPGISSTSPGAAAARHAAAHGARLTPGPGRATRRFRLPARMRDLVAGDSVSYMTPPGDPGRRHASPTLLPATKIAARDHRGQPPKLRPERPNQGPSISSGAALSAQAPTMSSRSSRASDDRPLAGRDYGLVPVERCQDLTHAAPA